MTALQVIATLVGIPVGLASVYSIYHSNFTDEARCETLRGNIVSMLDKSADASTLRMLVRRDVVNFESKCGAVDPDAVKAFKTLLARKPVEAPQVAHESAREPLREPVREVKQAEPQKPAPQAKPVEAKPVEAKRAEPKPAAETRVGEPTRDTETSDAKWVASVRGALLHAPDAPAAMAPAPVPAAPEHPLGQLSSAPARPLAARAAPAPASQAPALPAPVPVAAAPAAVSPADHPVPPGEIPDMRPADKPADTSDHSWMSKVPILNRVVGD